VVIEFSAGADPGWIARLGLAGRPVMKSVDPFKSIFWHPAPVDGRKQINGLSELVQDAMDQNPFGASRNVARQSLSGQFLLADGSWHPRNLA